MSRESRAGSPGSRVVSTDLLAAVSDLPRHEVERLLGKATGLSRTELLLGATVAGGDAALLADPIERRRRGEPLQYIEERVPFGPIEVDVDPRVLIPRPETEQLFELAASTVEEPRVIVDLCTGSGNLALALKHEFSDAVVYATDRSADAVAVARANAASAGLDVTVLQGDLFDPLPPHLRGHVDLVIANPPYVSEAELPGLPAEVRDHEPRSAIVAGPTGDEVVAAIAEQAPDWLAPGGVVACEISEFRGGSAARLFAPLHGVVQRDLAGKERFVVAAR
jgi:release factor glutamine methyltransferase